MGRKATALAIFVACALCIAIAGLAGLRPLDLFGSVNDNQWSVNGIDSEGQRLAVSTEFSGDTGCARFRGWEISESPDAVEITARLWEHRSPSSCDAFASIELATFTLDAPLGDRTLLGCGQPACRSTFAFHSTNNGLRWSTATPQGVLGIQNSGGSTSIRLLNALDGDARELSLGAEFSNRSDLQFVGQNVAVLAESGTVAAFDLTGEVLWRHPGWIVAADDDLLYICEGEEADGSLLSLDPRTGTEQWQSDAPCASPAIHGDLATFITFDHLVDGGMILVTMETETGRVLRDEVLLDGTNNDQVSGYDLGVRAGEFTIASGYQADFVAFDSDGTEVLRLPIRLGPPVGSAGNLVIIEGRGTIAGVEPSTGDIVWELDAAEQLIVEEGTLWRHDRATAEIVRLDPQTAEPLWSADIGVSGSLQVIAGADADIAYVQTFFEIHALDIGTGEVLWRTSISE